MVLEGPGLDFGLSISLNSEELGIPNLLSCTVAISACGTDSFLSNYVLYMNLRCPEIFCQPKNSGVISKALSTMREATTSIFPAQAAQGSDSQQGGTSYPAGSYLSCHCEVCSITRGETTITDLFSKASSSQTSDQNHRVTDGICWPCAHHSCRTRVFPFPAPPVL